MASPQLENGFARVANELLEALAGSGVTSRESKVLWAVLRETYGYSRKTRTVSYGRIAKLTRLGRQHVATLVRGLHERHYLVRSYTKGGLMMLGVQKDYQLWGTPGATAIGNTLLPAHGTPAVTADGNPLKKGTKETPKEVVVTRAREVEFLTHPAVIPPRVKTIIEEYLGPLCWNGTNVRLVTEWSEHHGEENVILAIEEAALANVARSRLLFYVRSTLENQEKAGYTWQPKVREWGGLVVVPDDPIV